MKALWFGFVRGLALPIYLLPGIFWGLRLGFDEWQEDTRTLRKLRTEEPRP